MRSRRLKRLSLAPLLMLSIASTADVSAAAAVGPASATVIAVTNTVSPVSISVAAPLSISPTNIAVAFPSITTTSVRSGNVPTTASLVAGAGAGGGDLVTVAGLTVSSVGAGSTVSFSIAGDTTSAYVVELAPPGGSAVAPRASQPGTSPIIADGPASNVPGSTSSLILTSQPLSGSGRLAIVLSQAPSDLIAGAISLSVNYN